MKYAKITQQTRVEATETIHPPIKIISANDSKNISAINITKRHNLPSNSIGYLEEEQRAKTNVWWWLIGSLLYIIVGNGLAVVTFYCYNGRLHPFSKILEDSDTKGKRRKTKELFDKTLHDNFFFRNGKNHNHQG